MQVANHLDDETLMRHGDVHASNVKLNRDVLCHQIQDDTEKKQQHIGYLYQEELKKLYSIAIYVWELVETTEAYMQKNSRNVTAHQNYEVLGLPRPSDVPDHLNAKKKCYERNKYRNHSMLSQHATSRAQKQFQDGELERVLEQIKEVNKEEATRLKMQHPNILGKRVYASIENMQ